MTERYFNEQHFKNFYPNSRKNSFAGFTGRGQLTSIILGKSLQRVYQLKIRRFLYQKVTARNFIIDFQIIKCSNNVLRITCSISHLQVQLPPPLKSISLQNNILREDGINQEGYSYQDFSAGWIKPVSPG